MGKTMNKEVAQRKIERLKKLHSKYATRLNDIELEIQRTQKILNEIVYFEEFVIKNQNTPL